MPSSTLENLFNHYIISSEISAWYTLSKCSYLFRIQHDDGNNKIWPLTISRFKFYWRHIKYTNCNKWKATKKKKKKKKSEEKDKWSRVRESRSSWAGQWRVMCRISIWKIKGEEGSQERNMIKRKVMETEKPEI